MSDAHIQAIADMAGARRAARLPATEVTAFELRGDGGVSVTLASGEVLTIAASDMVPEAVRRQHRERSLELLGCLISLVPSKHVRPAVVYQRRSVEVAEGQFMTIFVEAGR